MLYFFIPRAQMRNALGQVISEYERSATHTQTNPKTVAAIPAPSRVYMHTNTRVYPLTCSVPDVPSGLPPRSSSSGPCVSWSPSSAGLRRSGALAGGGGVGRQGCAASSCPAATAPLLPSGAGLVAPAAALPSMRAGTPSAVVLVASGGS